MTFLLNWAICALTMGILLYLVPGITIPTAADGWMYLIGISAVVGAVAAMVPATAYKYRFRYHVNYVVQAIIVVAIVFAFMLVLPPILQSSNVTFAIDGIVPAAIVAGITGVAFAVINYYMNQSREEQFHSDDKKKKKNQPQTKAQKKAAERKARDDEKAAEKAKAEKKHRFDFIDYGDEKHDYAVMGNGGASKSYQAKNANKRNGGGNRKKKKK